MDKIGLKHGQFRFFKHGQFRFEPWTISVLPGQFRFETWTISVSLIDIVDISVNFTRKFLYMDKIGFK